VCEEIPGRRNDVAGRIETQRCPLAPYPPCGGGRRAKRGGWAAAGAYGENVTDPAEVGPALRRGLDRIRAGTPAIISVWLPRLLQED
jgi:hypothetical protein